MTRLRANFKTGTITDNPLASGATTINSPELAGLPVVSAPDYMPLALDPEGVHGAPEIVWVTDHASAATSVTVVRHQEGTLARAHPSPSIWANTLTAQDIDELYDAVDLVVAALPGYLPLTGGSMVGMLTLVADPVNDLHAATKNYVDDLIGTGDFLPLSGGSLSGFLSLHADPTAALHAATKQYADTKSPSNHNHSGTYAPVSHTHPYAPTSHTHSYLPLTGGGLSGVLSLPNGSQSAPTLISADSNSGIYFGGASFAFAATCNGVAQFVVFPDRTEVRDNLDVTSHVSASKLYLTVPLSTSNNGLPGWRHNTSADALGWEFMRLTSSMRYKRASKPVDTELLVTQLKAAASKLISWQDKGSPKDSPRYIGISAEDAYEIVPTAVVLDENGKPDSVEPVNAFGVHLIAAVGQLLDRMDTLEAAVGI